MFNGASHFAPTRRFGNQPTNKTTETSAIEIVYVLTH